jgi:hypothetical protein
MGLLSWFRRRRRDAERIGDDEVERLIANEPQPRAGHYIFAHQALPALARHSPLGLFAALASENAATILGELLTEVAAHCRQAGEACELSADELTIHKLRIGEQPCIIIGFPQPRGTTEAHMVGLVLFGDLNADPPDPSSFSIRYITLERGSRADTGEARTVLGEWTADGSHCNFGDGPPPAIDEFARAIAAQVLSKGA